MKNIGLLAFALFWVLGCGSNDGNDTANDDDQGCALEFGSCPPNRSFDVETCACVLIEPSDPPPVDPCAECAEDQVCEVDHCVEKKPEGWVNPEDIVGLTYVYICFTEGTVIKPAGSMRCDPACNNCEDIPPLGFTLHGVANGDGPLSVAAATLDSERRFDPDFSVFLPSPTVDFSANPLLAVRTGGPIEFEIEGITLRIFDVEMTGVIRPDLSELDETTFRGFIDPDPLEEILGSDPCTLISGICNEDRLIEYLIKDLYVIRVDTIIPSPENLESRRNP